MREVKPTPAGRLVALEGIHSDELLSGAKQLLRYLKAPKARWGFSLWDASTIFHELASNADKDDVPSAKTMLILYATDLAFRLRWEIEPALAAGYTVVAAPYTRTAVQLGKAAGLSSRWLSALFEFAPPPAESYLASAKRRMTASPSPRAARSFPEFSFHQLAKLSESFRREDLDDRLASALQKDADAGRLKIMPR